LVLDLALLDRLGRLLLDDGEELLDTHLGNFVLLFLSLSDLDNEERGI
jgi:hypothetical protein